MCGYQRLLQNSMLKNIFDLNSSQEGGLIVIIIDERNGIGTPSSNPVWYWLVGCLLVFYVISTHVVYLIPNLYMNY